MTSPESMGRRETALDDTMKTLPLPALGLMMALIEKCGGESVAIDMEDLALLTNKRIQYGCQRGTIHLRIVAE